MSSKDTSTKSREDILAAREAKKLSKQKGKKKNASPIDDKTLPDSAMQSVQNSEAKINNEAKQNNIEPPVTAGLDKPVEKVVNNAESSITVSPKVPKGKDEVDRAVQDNKIIKPNVENEHSPKNCEGGNVNVLQSEPVISENIASEKSRDQIKVERAAKKQAKQAKKKLGDGEGDEIEKNSNKPHSVMLKNENSILATETNKIITKDDGSFEKKDLTVQEVVDTLKDIVNVAKDFQTVTDKVKAIDLSGKKAEESSKSKAELRAERRAKQEAQRAAKQAQQKAAEKPVEKVGKVEEKKAEKDKSTEKPKSKVQSMHRVNWFQHLYTEHDKEALKKIALNSNLHPAIIKLGVQLASQVVTGSNARCIALLDALKKMVRDYSLPAKTEFSRGLESHLAASLKFLWAMRQPSASQTNAVKHFRRQLTQLPNNVDEFDAKKTLQEEIDRYIREQIDMAGEAISIAVRNKISNGDNILTYGCSSLIERILCEAWESGLRFRAVVVGDRVRLGAREMLRRLTACGLPCTYADISAVSFLMSNINKVILGAGSLLVNGSVLGPVGTAQVALVARSHNVPVLVACETHKFSERVQTDAFVYNEIGDPDDLIDKNDPNSPLKDWRSNPNMTLLNLTYDVTPPSLVTAVVTELAILPCTSAPVVLRFKLSEYGM
ncbi:translation initiation factor eIF2B subunit delta [Battus philenor]|uniref:translation initiation factor eIF2B subunit delta n=1 Tax=Battus philenor TaxID=42288 RepID=UPI0035D096A5